MTNEILTQTLAKMPKLFSSNEFSRVAQKNGITKSQIAHGVISSFLNHNENIKRGDTLRTWYKVNPSSNNIIYNDVDEAIKLFKSKGYKVLKPVSEWQEL